MILKNKIFLGIISFIVIFFGVSLVIFSFFHRFKFKNKEYNKEYNNDVEDDKTINANDDFKDRIITESSKEWERFNF